ncbi:26S proteasome non-ATPase regulatory subunit 10-like isoform X2 [Corticium candelabrum]|uniref:26S proteasome non-ATPase regulatory subunit 10-like isoform X2 n=1 Tax=Corticium candelabrum TaxID=121492 RepID=UPI002E2696C0|nr:26S proteasome non-ATPase regulatory subunit 10-like isoform X2 [Corticium candelabrum]
MDNTFFHSKMAARADLNRQLFDAVTRNDVETSLSLLDNGADANASVALFGRKSRTNLAQACEYGHKAVIELLLKRGAAINEATSPDGSTALIIVIKRGFREDLLELLLLRGADINKKDNKGLTAMHWAAMINSSSVVNRLMRYGATVDIADNEGCTPLWYAACNVQLDCIRRLLSLGASPHRRCSSGRSPLHMCAEGSNDALECSHVLLEFGASPHLTDKLGRTPADVALKNDVRQLLESWQGRVRSLQLQIKTFLVQEYSRTQLMQTPLPRSLRQWVMS